MSVQLGRRAALGMMAAPLLAGTARAQWAPSRGIRMIAPYPPGGGVDTTSRLLAQPMGQFLGQSIVVENRAGAGGSIGAAEVARSAPDGHTIMIDAMAHTVNPALLRGLTFDYATAFTPISQVVVLPQLLVVNASLPVRNLQEFVAYVKARPGQLSYGSSGNATAAHLAAALFAARAELDIQHVPYRGGTPALADLMAARSPSSSAPSPPPCSWQGMGGSGRSRSARRPASPPCPMSRPSRNRVFLGMS